MAKPKATPKQFFAHMLQDKPVGLRTPGYDGCHLVYSRLAEAIREYYGLDKEGQRKFVDKAVADGIIRTSPCKGGPMVFLASTPMPERKTERKVNAEVADALKGL